MKYIYSVHFAWTHSSDDCYRPDRGIFFSSQKKAIEYYRARTNDYSPPARDTAGIIAQAPGIDANQVSGYYSVRKTVVR